MKIGVIGLQGSVSEHVQALKNALLTLDIKGSVRNVRTVDDLSSNDAIVIPGGESTTISSQMKRLGMLDKVREMAEQGTPVMGTCTGCILVAKEIVVDGESKRIDLLKLIDMKVKRNAFGRQKESFEQLIEIEGFDTPFKAVFIRAPLILETGGTTKVLSRIDEGIVMVKQGNILAIAFHPELTNDTRVHQMLIEMV